MLVPLWISLMQMKAGIVALRKAVPCPGSILCLHPGYFSPDLYLFRFSLSISKLKRRSCVIISLTLQPCRYDNGKNHTTRRRIHLARKPRYIQS